VRFRRFLRIAVLRTNDMPPDLFLDVAVSRQCLSLVNNGKTIRSYPISTAKNGIGEKRGSECTPTGWHRVRAKIGLGLPRNTVFVGRRPTGEIYNEALAKLYPGRDWILTRILWLGGLEPGKNRYGKVDTCWRYIYIHGTSDEHSIGSPASHGCIRMKNDDVMDLFDRVHAGIKVIIHE
jgi:lipoprotein-anchoring transpeptidase ErfK/SrfK